MNQNSDGSEFRFKGELSTRMRGGRGRGRGWFIAQEWIAREEEEEEEEEEDGFVGERRKKGRAVDLDR